MEGEGRACDDVHIRGVRGAPVAGGKLCSSSKEKRCPS